MVSDEFVLAITASLIAIAATEVIQYIKKFVESSNLKSKSIDLLVQELKTHHEFLEKHNVESVTKSNGLYIFNGVIFETTAFDSLVYSGVLRDLKASLQIKLSKTYEKIKMTNSLCMQIQQILALGDANSKQFQNSIDAFGQTYDKKLNDLLQVMCNSFPKIEQEQID